MGLFGKKKKKQLDDFSDEGEDNGPGGKDDGGMPAFQGSDDNPYADDPAHKHFVKLLDTNGLVRHRRAFIRNSVYHVGQAKECDADRLQKIGVFLEADRKKLLRIFKDSEAVESEIDKQREQEKMDAERQKEEEDEDRGKEKSSKKKKKGKKDKKKKKKSKKDKFSDDEDIDDLGLSDEDEKPKKKKKKKKKGKKKENDFDEDEGEGEEEEEKISKKKGKKSKKGKKGKKKKKKEEKEGDFDEDKMDDFDDFGEDIDEKPAKSKKSKGKKGKSKKDKKNKKSKKKKSDNHLEMDDLDDDLDREMSSPEPQTDREDIGMSEEELYTAQAPEVEVIAKPKEESREVVIKEIEQDIKETEKKREKRMSHGSQALKLLNKKLGKGARSRRSSLASTNSRRPRSVATVDEEEELWWKDLGTKDKSSTGRRISFTDESYSEASVPMKKSKSKVKAHYGSNVEYLTDAEHEILKDFRKQRKVTRRHRPVSQQYYAQSHPPVPAYNVAHMPPPMPPPIFKNSQVKPETNLQPPGEAVRQQRSPTSSPNIPPNMVHTQAPVPPNPYQYYYPPPPPMPYLPPVEQSYYHHSEQEEEEAHSDGASTVDYSKYKYYKERYNQRKKEKKRRKLEALKKQKRKQQRKRPTKEKKRTKKEFVDVSKDLNKDSELWPVRSIGEYVNDSELNAESSDHESRVQRYGNDDYFFNYNNQEEEQFVKKGRRGKNNKKQRVNYFSAPSSGYESENNDGEMYILRKKLAEIGASRFYPILIKYGIMSLQHCTLSKLEKLPIASRSKKAALIRAILQVKKGSRNRKSLLASDYEFSDSSIKEVETKKNGKLGLKSSLKKRSMKEHQRRRKVGTSKGQSGKSRHYFAPGGLSLAESDNEPDHVKVVKKVETEDSKSQDKKSVTFDLKDEDEISLPSYSDIEDNSDSDLSVAFSD